ncbi:4'-phosphopantetheinyl transferase family protein [Flavihumibacter profundi]|uniref:4'-phosphopantetheinyl transferase family protein n=1 Tax=Flavihumibacter profundi TaxID=2716883 RepID=UPI001CC61D4E|nr:4'-phosphopantetheinyl transferase superfamily protein [Flavihumibacter profundi]MBZ5859376.1 4'-phosphopantetheinyl transferase superfamily protein [Flavihumibacter profundi]
MDNEELQWRPAIPGELISSNEVHVWRAWLDLTALQYENLLGFLSKDELARAKRFRFERDQKRFIVARGILRQILGRYLGKKPNELVFEYSSQGKPALATYPGCGTLHFNLSHSDGFALYAVTRDRNIGIDIERIRDDAAVDQIARRFYSQGEISSLFRMHIDRRTELFFQYWTRKEAFIKAIGEGISFPMEQCDVSLISGSVLSPIILHSDKIESLRWYGQDLFPGCGYAAAIAVEGTDWDLSFWHYTL